MCGIVGFTGAAQAAPILLDGLAKLEYRGYDSAGLAVQNAAGKIEVVKAKGRLKVLSEMTRTIPVTRKSLSYTTASLKTTWKLKSAC